MYMILTFHFHTKVYKLKTKLRPLTHMHLMSNSFITNGVQKMITEWRTDRRTDGRPKQMPQATLRTLWRWHTNVNQNLDSLKDTVRNPKKTYHTVFPSHTDFSPFFFFPSFWICRKAVHHYTWVRWFKQRHAGQEFRHDKSSVFRRNISK